MFGAADRLSAAEAAGMLKADPRRNSMRRFSIVVAVAAAAGLAFTSTGLAAGHAASRKTRHSQLGTFLVDGKGRTLYLFRKDKTSKSRCSGDCATEWPPLLTTGKPKTSGLVRKSLLGTSRRSDGKALNIGRPTPPFRP
jgi:predicted lipoprotein with Yx(FWY)xxD motif